MNRLKTVGVSPDEPQSHVKKLFGKVLLYFTAKGLDPGFSYVQKAPPIGSRGDNLSIWCSLFMQRIAEYPSEFIFESNSHTIYIKF